MNADHSFHAVLTADIVNSTGLEPAAEALLQKQLQQGLSPYLVEFYRGDSFQAYLEDPGTSLRVALLCRAWAIGLPTTEEGPEGPALSDIRISIGLGPVARPVRTPGMAKGEAFLLSGRGLDEIQKTDRRLAVLSGNVLADIGLEAMTGHLDAIFREMTPKQAAAIAWLLQGATRQEATEKLGKSKSTVSQLVAAGHWIEIERILQQFERVIKQLQ